MTNSKLNIMDVTLRDGSYAINFQFSESDTMVLYQGLAEAGIEYIEIGHGVGLGASSQGNGFALCSDEEYLAAAQRCKGNSKYGMFCIPGIGELDDLKKLKEYGASFVRIGTNVNEVEKSAPYIELAKKLGLEVMANYMKSYASTRDEFKSNVQKSIQYGADVIYIVDSAGGMSETQIEGYFDIIKSVGDIKVGFHGHDNMGLALSNSLFAIKKGFDFVDSSLKGMGRSAGNASTELLCANLLKWYEISKYDCKKLIECAEQFIKPIYNHMNHNALDIYSGIADFHSSYMKYIHKYSSKYNVNPLDLIIEYTKYDKIDMNEKVLDEIASRMPLSRSDIHVYGFQDYFGSEQ